MLGNRELIVDVNCGLRKELAEISDDTFYSLQQHTIQHNCIYIIGYLETINNVDKIKELVTHNVIKVIFSNPVEGSQTIINHCRNLGLLDLIREEKILLLSGGDVAPEYPHLTYDNFLPKVLDYNENITARQTYQENFLTVRPYKFLFLNGQQRHHRKFMINSLSELLGSALWTNLDSGNGPIKLLDQQYEHDRFKVNFPITDKNVKSKLFGTGIWGDILLSPAQYINTYFSVVTETVHNYPYSFRTEKIWKPIVIGHPWIAVANRGFYRDMRNLGFQTFGQLINESFDTTDNDQDRLAQVADVIKDLCQQDLVSFIKATQSICQYNIDHLDEMKLTVRKELPKRFVDFVNKYIK